MHKQGERDSIIVAAVAKKLKKYLDIQRREQAFDLSQPKESLCYPQENIKVLHNNYFENHDDIEEISKASSIKYEIRKMQSIRNLTGHECKTRIKMERQMARHTSPSIVSPYAYPVNAQEFVTTNEPLLTRKSSRSRRVSSTGRVGRGQRLRRQAPPQKITSAERERIVNLTTKLLVATETIALPINKKQSREMQTHTESFPVIPALRRVQKMRPKSAYSDPGPSVFKPTKPLSASRVRSAGKLERSSASINSNNSSFINKHEDSDFYVTKNDHNYIVKKRISSYPSSVVSINSTRSLNRPKSGIRSNYICHQTQLASSDEDIYDHSSTEVTPYNTPRTGWLESAGIERSVSDISTQTIQSRSTQTGYRKLPEDETFEERHIIAESSIFKPSTFTPSDIHSTSEDSREGIESMATQTRRRDVEPKVLTYEIYVVTGNKLGGGTKANIKVNIFGEYGDTGDRPLIKSKFNQSPFQRNQMDLFHMDCMFLGTPSNIRIGHDGKALGDGWYLERVIIKEGEKATRAFNFVCNNWLSAKEGDGQIVRDLKLTQQIPISEIPSYSKSNLKTALRKLSSSEESHGRRSSSAMSNASVKSPKREPITVQSDKNKASAKKSQRPSNHKAPTPTNNKLESSSSDSEAEREIREVEKRKRREKKLSKDSSIEKPKANLGGIINKVHQPIKQAPRRRSSTDSQTSGRSTPSKKLSSSSPQGRKSADSRKGSVKSPSPVPSSRKTPITLGRKVTPLSNPTPPPVSNKLSAPPTNIEAESSFKVSSTNTSSDSSSEDEKPIVKPVVKPAEKKEEKENGSDDEVMVEFSNTNTTKKYSLDTTGQENNFMAGFIAGIKANKTKETGEEKEAKEKEEFEEQLRQGSTIHEACEDGDVDRVKELILQVAELKEKVDERGWSPIHISAAFGHLDLVKWFSVTGVSLTKETPTGYTAIHLAALNGHVNCIMILAAMGCPISSRTVDNSTPLHLAAMSGHIECVKWLLSNRAKLDVTDSNGRTPYDLAEEYQHAECIQLLKVMKKELTRKDSVMSLLRDPSALRKLSIDQGNHNRSAVGGYRNADSGVGGESNEEEEWISDAEDTSDVIGRGGDERPPVARRTSNEVGRKQSVARKESAVKKSSVSVSGIVSARKLSRQDIRKKSELEEKRRNYEKQKRQSEVRKTSFLDSIRQDIDGHVSPGDF